MLHLQPRVHLEKIESSGITAAGRQVHQELNRARIPITGCHGRGNSR